MAPAQCTVCKAAFKSKNECNTHRMTAGHSLKAVFFCLGCSETFAVLKALKTHQRETGHLKNAPEGFAFSVAGPKSSRPPKVTPTKSAWAPGPPKTPPAVPTCSACNDRFETFHELAEHRRTAHGKEPLVEMKCQRCAQKIPWGEVHTRCTQAPERVACPLCRQKFGPAELAEHRLANPLSCEVCAVHLPAEMSLQDHWRVSNLHPYCKMCDNAFRDHREWVAHTLTCSLARNTLAPGSVGGAVVSNSWTYGLVKEVVSDSEGITFRNPTPDPAKPAAPQADWFLSGLPQANPVQSEGSSRRSSLSSLSKASEDAEEHSVHAPIEHGPPEPEQAESPEPDTRDEDVSETGLVEILAHEYGQHSIERILSVLEDEDEEPAEKPKSGRSLLSPTRPAVLSGGSIDSGYMCDTSLVAHCSSAWEADASPPMLGCRREARKPLAALDIAATSSPSESSSDKVESWLEEQSQLSRTSQPCKSFTRAAGGRATGVTSWHCRVCLRQDCNKPVATSCGHVFCQSCILEKLKADAGCPVCREEFFVRLEPTILS